MAGAVCEAGAEAGAGHERDLDGARPGETGDAGHHAGPDTSDASRRSGSGRRINGVADRWRAV